MVRCGVRMSLFKGVFRKNFRINLVFFVDEEK